MSRHDDVLHTTLLLYLDGQPQVLFQQDNACLQNGRSTMDLFQDATVNTLPWSANLPNLYPIEYIWDVLGN